jgi:hypothetical protein
VVEALVAAASSMASGISTVPFTEPSDTVAVGSHAGQDCGLILSSGVGEPPTGSDFTDGRDGRKSVGGIGRRSDNFGLWDLQERENGQ